MAVVLWDESSTARRGRADNDPFGHCGGVRLGHSLSRKVEFNFGDQRIKARVAYQGGSNYAVKVEGEDGDGPVFTVRGGLEQNDGGEGGATRTELVCAVDGVVSRQGVLVKEDR